MPNQKKARRVIIDTNLWISFLIGKELHYLKELLVSDKVKLIICDQLIDELQLVTNRKKLRKYFDDNKVAELIELLNIISEKIQISRIDNVCRDPKDDFLLALCKTSKATYLITGDCDLLDLKVYGKTQILTVRKFTEKIIK